MRARVRSSGKGPGTMSKPADNADYHFSIQVHVGDEAVLYCLRGLSMWAQKKGSPYKPWDKAGGKEWRDHHRIVNFHFTSTEFRQAFRDKAAELLAGKWEPIVEKDNDPMLE